MRSPPERRVQLSQDTRPPLQKNNPDVPLRIDVRIVRSEGFVDEGVKLGSRLNSCGSASDDHEG
jgi:hypothetical protein